MFAQNFFGRGVAPPSGLFLMAWLQDLEPLRKTMRHHNKIRTSDSNDKMLRGH